MDCDSLEGFGAMLLKVFATCFFSSGIVILYRGLWYKCCLRFLRLGDLFSRGTVRHLLVQP